ncbi:hypothetical protein [Streptomyces sp. NPDC012888]
MQETLYVDWSLHSWQLGAALALPPVKTTAEAARVAAAKAPAGVPP